MVFPSRPRNINNVYAPPGPFQLLKNPPFLKKVAHIFGRNRKSAYLCTRFSGTVRGTAADNGLSAAPEACNGSLTDCEQEDKTAQSIRQTIKAGGPGDSKVEQRKRFYSEEFDPGSG